MAATVSTIVLHGDLQLHIWKPKVLTVNTFTSVPQCLT